jgi:hypothetical protein
MTSSPAHIFHLLQLRQGFFYGGKVRQILGRGSLLAVLNHPVFIDHKRGPRGCVAYSGKHRKQHVIFLRHDFVQVAGERDADFFLLRPRFLREGRVHAQSDHIGVEARVLAQTRRDVAQFSRANAGEGRGEEQQDRVFLAEIIRELHIHQAGGLFRFQGEIGSFGANR